MTEVKLVHATTPSRVGGNLVKHIKNLFFICLFYQICNFYINIEVIFLDSRFRGNDIRVL
ncbi:hypothetical protein [Rickettsia asembonensis]|uniref:hypothetical protein n=1 Tax=Rickettsia asembonensis TaxID=1068590 RepID=UPI0018F24967|nr:hypothetical protein [Rickettsia asembonensis]